MKRTTKQSRSRLNDGILNGILDGILNEIALLHPSMTNFGEF